ncbi:uncharacterized protein PV06_02821 [Exophiala oligosperma]|uniref:Uncharacterized protein n=2 Tax=Chaetothyriales TaxID=34395 RepID=A0A0D2DVW4_9EURO|nr:uncharacterized protein PV06_02821 [Exophiala oligosperma]KAJ9635584.1 hypothetical protein H2204_005758 [Knufia peltigerae]KIW47233.1 hypothetical protein PV06_02821 [Exophiala oligosperma]
MGPNAARLDTRTSSSYFSFSFDEDMRSPRTPTYVPDTPSLEYIVPFDHTKMAVDSVQKPLGSENNNAIPKPPPPPPPDEPMAWVWMCHLCHSRYPLGVTRRCLVDGHYYCAGETDRPSLRRKKKNKSCSSEFDYVAWKAWATWRRKVFQIAPHHNHNNPPRTLRGCENCEFPSQCRYPPSPPQTGTGSKVDEEYARESKKATREEKKENQKKSVTTAAAAATTATSDGSVDFDQILNNILVQKEEKEEELEYGQTKGSSCLDQNHAGKTSRMKKGNGRKTTSQSQKGLVQSSSLEEEMSREAARLREMVGMDLWSTLEDVDLEKTKVD